MGKVKNFHAHGDKFLCAQKNIFVRTEISLLAEEKIGAFGRRKISFRKEENFRICENIFFLYTEISLLIYGAFLPWASGDNG